MGPWLRATLAGRANVARLCIRPAATVAGSNIPIFGGCSTPLGEPRVPRLVFLQRVAKSTLSAEPLEAQMPTSEGDSEFEAASEATSPSTTTTKPGTTDKAKTTTHTFNGISVGIIPTRHSRKLLPPVAAAWELPTLVSELLDAKPGSLYFYQRPFGKGSVSVKDERETALIAADATRQKVEYTLRGLAALIPETQTARDNLWKQSRSLPGDEDDDDSESISKKTDSPPYDAPTALELMLQLLERIEQEGRDYVELMVRTKMTLVPRQYQEEEPGWTNDEYGFNDDWQDQDVEVGETEEDEENGDVQEEVGEFEHYSEEENGDLQEEVGEFEHYSEEESDDVHEEVGEFEHYSEEESGDFQEEVGEFEHYSEEDEVYDEGEGQYNDEDGFEEEQAAAEEHVERMIAAFGSSPGPSIAMYDVVLDAMAIVAETNTIMSPNQPNLALLAQQVYDQALRRHKLDTGDGIRYNTNILTAPTAMTYNATIRCCANAVSSLSSSSSSSSSSPRIRDDAMETALTVFDAMYHDTVVLRNSATYREMLRLFGNALPPCKSRGNMCFALYHKVTTEERCLDNDILDVLRTVAMTPSNGPDFDQWTEETVANKSIADLAPSFSANAKRRRYRRFDATY